MGPLSNDPYICATQDVTKGKPAPDGFLLAAERLGVPPSACVGYEGEEAVSRQGVRQEAGVEGGWGKGRSNMSVSRKAGF